MKVGRIAVSAIPTEAISGNPWDEGEIDLEGDFVNIEAACKIVDNNWIYPHEIIDLQNVKIRNFECEDYVSLKAFLRAIDEDYKTAVIEQGLI